MSLDYAQLQLLQQRNTRYPNGLGVVNGEFVTYDDAGNAVPIPPADATFIEGILASVRYKSVTDYQAEWPTATQERRIDILAILASILPRELTPRG